MWRLSMKASSLFDVSELITVVTGGASGIGLAYAEAMADNGALVTIFDVDQPRLDAEASGSVRKGSWSMSPIGTRSIEPLTRQCKDAADLTSCSRTPALGVGPVF